MCMQVYIVTMIMISISVYVCERERERDKQEITLKHHCKYERLKTQVRASNQIIFTYKANYQQNH
jgi:hypothetical protein